MLVDRTLIALEQIGDLLLRCPNGFSGDVDIKRESLVSGLEAHKLKLNALGAFIRCLGSTFCSGSGLVGIDGILVHTVIPREEFARGITPKSVIRALENLRRDVIPIFRRVFLPLAMMRHWLRRRQEASHSIAWSPPNLNRFTKFSFQIRCALCAPAPM